MCKILMTVLSLLLFVGSPVVAQDQTIMNIAAANPDFSTLINVIQVAGLVDALNGEGPFTIFAPTNAAFQALGIDTLRSLMAERDMLTGILTYHVIADRLMAADFLSFTSVTTLQGSDIAISIRDGNIFLNDNVQVVTTDIEASNGVIHAIDAVLLPPVEIEATPIAEIAPEPAHLRVAHFSPDMPAVDVYVNGLLSPVQELAFTEITDWISLPAGTYNVAVAPAATSIEKAVIGPTDFDLPEGAWITVAAVGSLENETLKPAIVIEDYSPIDDGSVRVTVFHAMEDAPAFDVRAGGVPVIRRLGFPGSFGGNDGAFTINVPAGSVDLRVTPTGRSAPVVIDLPGTSLAANTHYFVAAVGTLAEPEVIIKAIDMAAVANTD